MKNYTSKLKACLAVFNSSKLVTLRLDLHETISSPWGFLNEQDVTSLSTSLQQKLGSAQQHLHLLNSKFPPYSDLNRQKNVLTKQDWNGRTVCSLYKSMGELNS